MTCWRGSMEACSRRSGRSKRWGREQRTASSWTFSSQVHNTFSQFFFFFWIMKCGNWLKGRLVWIHKAANMSYAICLFFGLHLRYFGPFHMNHHSPFPVVLLPPTPMWKFLPRWAERVYVCVYTRVWFPSLLPSPSFLRRHLLVSQVLSIFSPPIRLPESVWKSPQKPESLVSAPLCMHIVPSAHIYTFPSAQLHKHIIPLLLQLTAAFKLCILLSPERNTTSVYITFLGKGAKKKKRKKSGLLPNWGGGGSRMVVKCQTAILEKYFFS